jgi:hypothetical protein
MAVRKRSLFGYSVFQLPPGGLYNGGKCSRSEMLNVEKMRPRFLTVSVARPCAKSEVWACLDFSDSVLG